MPPLSADDVMSAIDRAADEIPNLQVVITDCGDHTWILDPRTCTVYVDGTASPDQWSAALSDALKAMCDALSTCDPRPGLRLVEPTTEEIRQVRTGTCDPTA